MDGSVEDFEIAASEQLMECDRILQIKLPMMQPSLNQQQLAELAEIVEAAIAEKNQRNERISHSDRPKILKTSA